MFDEQCSSTWNKVTICLKATYIGPHYDFELSPDTILYRKDFVFKNILDDVEVSTKSLMTETRTATATSTVVSAAKPKSASFLAIFAVMLLLF